MKNNNSILRVGLLVFSFSLLVFADDHYVLKLKNSGSIGQVSGGHGVKVVKALTGSASGIFVVGAPAGPFAGIIAQGLAADPMVAGVENDSQVDLPLPELDGSPVRMAGQPKLPPLYSPNQSMNYYGTMVWDPYVNQPAASMIGLTAALHNATGRGVVVALIDTGVDPHNVVLKPWLTGGYDFTRGIAGGSEMTDVNQSTTEVLDDDGAGSGDDGNGNGNRNRNQSTTEVLDFSTAVVLDDLNQSTTEVLDDLGVGNQSTTEVLDRNKPPAAFGHGTMTAGLVHLVAPQANLMPLKAFSATGIANISDIVAAVYYAVDHDADIISMSFNSTADSPTLRTAIAFANAAGVTCVAAVGNSGQQTSQIYPAVDPGVIAVASVNNQDVRSSFSNYGNHLVTLAAPGEGVITTYPGTNNYAAGWGTSFSTPLVAGGAALLVDINKHASNQAIQTALTSGATPEPGQGIGAGVLNLPAAIIDYQPHH